MFGSACGCPGLPAAGVPAPSGTKRPSHHDHHSFSSCKGKTAWLDLARTTAGALRPQPGGPRPARTARPLSFCDLPLEGTSCSPQQGNKRSPLAPDLPGETGLRSPGDAPAAALAEAGETFLPNPLQGPLEGHRPHQPLKLAALPSPTVILG